MERNSTKRDKNYYDQEEVDYKQSFLFGGVRRIIQ